MAKNKQNNKVVKPYKNPVVSKTPRYNDPQIDGHPMAWRFSGCDRAGPFGWDGLTPGDKYKEVIGKLHEFETKNAAQLRDAGCHAIAVDRLDGPAKTRLREIKQDDIEELMEFRMSGPERVWCIQTGHIMRMRLGHRPCGWICSRWCHRAFTVGQRPTN